MFSDEDKFPFRNHHTMGTYNNIPYTRYRVTDIIIWLGTRDEKKNVKFPPMGGMFIIIIRASRKIVDSSDCLLFFLRLNVHIYIHPRRKYVEGPECIPCNTSFSMTLCEFFALYCFCSPSDITHSSRDFHNGPERFSTATKRIQYYYYYYYIIDIRQQHISVIYYIFYAYWVLFHENYFTPSLANAHFIMLTNIDGFFFRDLPIVCNSSKGQKISLLNVNKFRQTLNILIKN